MDIVESLSKIGIVPVLEIEDAEDSEKIASALINGGINCAEVTFRTDAAEESIKRICKKYPGMLVGAGTVLTVEQAKRAIGAGAKFIVAPGFNGTVVDYCKSQSVPMIPGVSTPTEVEAALSLGLDILKFFPAEASGGLKMIKAMSAPYNKVKFLPTGGINESNINDYLQFKKVFACGGSWMVAKDIIKAKEFGLVEEKAFKAVCTVLGLQIVGIEIGNSEISDDARKAWQTVNGMLSECTEGDICQRDLIGFREDSLCIVSLKTNSLNRAVYHLAERGISLRAVSETESIAEYGDFRIIIRQ